MRTRRAFSQEFKAAAVVRMRSEPAAHVARACEVNVGVLNRWRRELDGSSTAGPANVPGRRTFSKKFKHDAVVRLDHGEPTAHVARSCGVSPDVVRRWWRETAQFGDLAFSGYGKRRSPTEPARAVVIRFSAEEYEVLEQACAGSSSLPDFARLHLLKPSASLVARVEAQLEQITSTVNRLVSLVAEF